MISRLNSLLQSLGGAVVFYTIIPLPANIKISWERIARFSPMVGLMLGSLLSLADLLTASLSLPILTRSALLIALWVGLTGGLHLDGAMDSADGLAVSEPQRRLQVMGDSHSGAFGVMAAILILLLKTLALSDLTQGRWFVLMGAAGWGRWGQLSAIAFYPYLKPTGKGAFHKQSLHFPADVIWGWLTLIGFSLIYLLLSPAHQLGVLGMTLGGMAIALLTGYYFYCRLGGHTGDTYGAVVEWTETFFLCLSLLLS